MEFWRPTPAEGLRGAVLWFISDSDLGSEGDFEIGRFGTPKGCYFEICPSVDRRAAGAYDRLIDGSLLIIPAD
jgi:hypothetical protein